MLTFGGHKGSALSTTVELLAGPLIDDMICKELKAFDGGLDATPFHSELILIFDPSMFLGEALEKYLARSEPHPPIIHLRFRRSLAASRSRRLSGRRVDQFSLRHRSADDCAGVDFTAAFRQQGASRGHRLVQGYRRQRHVGIAGFHEVSGWPSNEDARHVARIVFDKQAPVRTPDVGAERRRPIAQTEQVNAGRPQGALLLGQECQPEAQSILWQPKGNLALVLPPDRDRRAAQGCRGSTDDRSRRCRGRCSARVPAASVPRAAWNCISPSSCSLLNVVPGSRCNFPICGADQTLDVTAEARLARWPPLDGDAGVLASSLERPAAEISVRQTDLAGI